MRLVLEPDVVSTHKLDGTIGVRIDPQDVRVDHIKTHSRIFNLFSTRMKYVRIELIQ